MRLLSRVLFTFALLGGLAYGSYAFGKYVLSSHLFGPQGASLKKNFEGTQAVVTRPQKTVTGAPRADIEVLPADADDSGAPPLSSLERNRSASSRSSQSNGSNRGDNSDTPAPTPSATQESSPGNPFAIKPVGGAQGDATSRERPGLSEDNGTRSDDPNRQRRRRRRRRARTAQTDSMTQTTRQNSASNGDGSPARSEAAPTVLNDDPGDAPTPPTETRAASGDNNSDDAPIRRRRERVRSNSGESAPRIERSTSRPARRLDTSPIPRPEGESGGDSPVPIPE